MVHALYLTLIILLAFGCASGHRQTSQDIRRHVVAGEFDLAVELIKASPMATDEKSKLLLFIELGLLEHYRGQYEASSEALTKAKAIIDELYTTRISGKVSSFIGNDNSDFYYGEKYEASLVYFYLALNSYMRAIQEPDQLKRKTLLLQARAEVLDWDSFLSEIKKDRLGQALFKEDLLAKIFGALVHESQESKVDDQIALQLYKDAREVFFKNYNLYPSFNNAFQEFRKNFEMLPSLEKTEVEGKYVLDTPHSIAFKAFLTTKIQQLSAKSKPKKNVETRVSFLIQDGLIAEKVPQRYEIPMIWGPHATTAMSMGMGQNITFELPTVQGVETLNSGKIQAINQTGQIIKETDLMVVAPLGEMAYQAIQEHSASIASKTAARVTAKHLSALIGSAVTYESGRRNNSTVTMLFAIAAHASSVAAINQSEQADVRFWSTLPSSIRMAEISLPPGSYHFQAVYASGPSQRIVDLGFRIVSAKGTHFVMSNKDLQFKGNLSNSTAAVRMPTSTNEASQNTASIPSQKSGCMQNTDCPDGTVCATVRGEYPGSCAGTGLLGGLGRNLSGSSESKGCMTNSDCYEGKVCATVRGEYPGWCASR